jgi:hypothetical protein
MIIQKQLPLTRRNLEGRLRGMRMHNHEKYDCGTRDEPTGECGHSAAGHIATPGFHWCSFEREPSAFIVSPPTPGPSLPPANVERPGTLVYRKTRATARSWRNSRRSETLHQRQF